MKKQIIYVNCWKCGQVMPIIESEYVNGLICDDCLKNISSKAS